MNREALAEVLWKAEWEHRPIPPLTTTHPDLTIADAYAIQAINISRRLDEGRVIRGRKVGLTSKPMQALLGVEEPDFGVLVDDMFVEEGDDLALDTLLQPRIEAEVAFVMGEDLSGPGVTTSDALVAIRGALPALEIVDSRVADWRITLVDTIADNASSGRLVIGGRLTPATAVDLRLVGVAISRNGRVVDTGAGAAALGNPLRCVAWLANKLAEFGSSLRRGDVILSGALHRMLPVASGDVFRADFSHLGSVSVRFVGSKQGGSE